MLNNKKVREWYNMEQAVEYMEIGTQKEAIISYADERIVRFVVNTETGSCGITEILEPNTTDVEEHFVTLTTDELITFLFYLFVK